MVVAYVMVIVSVAVLPEESVAVTLNTFDPRERDTVPALHVVVPAMVSPEDDTDVIVPTLSAELPERVTLDDVVVNSASVDGEVMVMVGGVS